jgi:hypothetical protein
MPVRSPWIDLNGADFALRCGFLHRANRRSWIRLRLAPALPSSRRPGKSPSPSPSIGQIYHF